MSLHVRLYPTMPPVSVDGVTGPNPPFWGLSVSCDDEALAAQVALHIHDALYFGNGEERGLEALDGKRAVDCLVPLLRGRDTLWPKSDRLEEGRRNAFLMAAEFLEKIRGECATHPSWKLSSSSAYVAN